MRAGMTASAQFRLFPNLYKDSVSLMQLGAKLRAREGIAEASCIMATPANLEQLRDADLAVDAAARAFGPARGRPRRRRSLRGSPRGGRVDAAILIGRDERRRRGRVSPAA
jgi:hypothetical protein